MIKTIRIAGSLCVAMFFLLIISGCISVQGLSNIVQPNTKSLDEKTIIAGLKEALSIFQHCLRLNKNTVRKLQQNIYGVIK